LENILDTTYYLFLTAKCLITSGRYENKIIKVSILNRNDIYFYEKKKIKDTIIFN
jgi:hypothetical protein